jgi:hypothetical protein
MDHANGAYFDMNNSVCGVHNSAIGQWLDSLSGTAASGRAKQNGEKEDSEKKNPGRNI